MSTSWVGLDIGGANLKVASPSQLLAHEPFPLWKKPYELFDKLRELTSSVSPAASLAITMTGELADCYAHKREGVLAIVEAVERACPGREIHYYKTGGSWCQASEAADNWQELAASNWHALALCIARERTAQHLGPALLVDWGSTTCDLIPIADGQVQAVGISDPTRMMAGELLYTGSRRSPLIALLPKATFDDVEVPLAQELFATILDAYLVSGLLAEEPAESDTADGRPATVGAARQRIARMLCADSDELDRRQILSLAEQAICHQQRELMRAIQRQLELLQERFSSPVTIVLSGAGEELLLPLSDRVEINRVTEPTSPLRDFVREFAALRDAIKIESISWTWGAELSSAAPAVAVARLAEVEFNRADE